MVAAILAVGSSPAPAQLSGVSVSAGPGFPNIAQVGAQNQPAVISITNNSFGPSGTQPVNVNNIRLNPSCASGVPAPGPDPCLQPETRPLAGIPILSVDNLAVGRAGTACAGIVFSVSPPNASGTVTFAPNSPVVLGPTSVGGPATSCLVDFTFDVLQRPLDGSTFAVSSVDYATASPPSGGTVSGSSAIVVTEAPTTIVTRATAQTVPEGTGFGDAATVTGVPGGPPLTGSVLFTLYRSAAGNAGFPTCTAGEQVGTTNSSVVQVAAGPAALNGAPTATAAFNPLPVPPAGRYVFVATYDPSGSANPDVDYLSATSACADPNERVVVNAALPTISVQKTASPSVVNEPGGTVTFSVLVTNTGPRDVTVTSLTDNVYGDLNGRGTCSSAPPGSRPPTIPLLPANGATYTCSFTAVVSGNAGEVHTDVVTAVAIDVNGNAATATDDATVTVRDVAPFIGVAKSATPPSLPFPGGTFTFSVIVTNFGIEAVTVTSLNDDIYGGLSTRPGSTCGTLVGSTLAVGASATCTFTGTFTGPAGAIQTDIVTVTVVDNDGTTGTARDDATVIITSTGNRYTPLSPSRIVDTRTGAGGLGGPVGPGATVDVQITGRGGVPAGATAVVLNVTVTGPTAAGFLTLYPSGTSRPLAANVNFTPAKTVPNLVVVKLGTGGRVALFNSAGTTDVIFDVAGYWDPSASSDAGRYQPLVPARIADTRTGAGGVRLGPGQSFDLQVTGQGGAPATGVSAAVLNVAVTGTTAGSFLTVYPTGEARPLAANLNWVAGDTVSNRTMTKVGVGGKVTIYNYSGATDVIVDLGGTYTDASVPGTLGTYTPLDPARIVDTRASGIIPAGGTVDVQVAGMGGVPATGVRAVVLNVAVTQPAAAGFFTMYPGGAARPVASDLNYAAGETRSNLVVVQVGANGRVSLFSSAQAHVVVDVAGWFP